MFRMEQTASLMVDNRANTNIEHVQDGADGVPDGGQWGGDHGDGPRPAQAAQRQQRTLYW